MKTSSRSLFGSKRSRFFSEPRKKSGKSLLYRRKQRVKFRTRYAGSVAKQWSKVAFNATIGAATLGAIMWGAVSVGQAWKSSPTLRVKEIIFSGDIPERLRLSFPIKENSHLIDVNATEIEQNALAKYPELKDFSISRRLDRVISVKGEYRTAVAQTHGQGEPRAMDESGVLFRAPDSVALETLPRIETASIENRKLLLSYLQTWRKKTPEFYSLVKKIETDRMRELNVELSDGVSISWGPLDEADVVERAKKVLRLRELFQPVKTPASLLFVGGDRIVMDKNWKKK